MVGVEEGYRYRAVMCGSWGFCWRSYGYTTGTYPFGVNPSATTVGEGLEESRMSFETPRDPPLPSLGKSLGLKGLLLPGPG